MLLRISIVLALLLSVAFSAQFALANNTNTPQVEEAMRRDTPSGLPVPRFVSLRGPQDFCRRGPSKAHPVLYTYKRSGLPVMVVAETRDHWRKIRDADGDECWAFHTRLKAQTHVLTKTEIVLHATPKDGASARGLMAERVLAKIVAQRGDNWLLIEAGGVKGWVRTADVWGVLQRNI